MKKFFIIFSVFLYTISFIPTETFALSKTQVAEISKIENDLYGFDYLKEDINNRIARIEKTVYGKELKGEINKRLKKLSEDLFAAQIGQEIEPKEDTFEEIDTVADSTVSYPIVNEIESKIFNKTYPERDFHTRIVTIERELFGKIYDVDDYATRMDRIKAEVMPERLAREKVFGYDNSNDFSLNSNSLGGINNSRYSSLMPYGQENYTRPYTNYGDYNNETFNTQNSFNDDLAQLEYETFGTEFSDDDTKARIKRLNSVNKAQKSASKYDSMKYQQRMSSFMEIGAMLLMLLAMVL